MENKYLIALLTLIFTFVFTFVNLYFIGSKNMDEKKSEKYTFWACFAVLAISFLIIPLFISDFDFEYDYSYIETIMMLAFAGLSFIISSIDKIKKFGILIPLFAAAALYMFIPDNSSLDNEKMILVHNLLLIVFFLLVAYMFKYINGLEGIMAIQTFFIGIGLFIFSALSATSTIIGTWGAVLLGVFFAFYIFNAYPSRLKISNHGAGALGIIIAWILVKNAEESSIGCSIILSIYILTEVSFAILKKLSLLPKYQDIYVNTFTYRANVKGLSVQIVNSSVMKILMLLLILGCMQIYSTNMISIPLLSVIIMFWFLNKLANWDAPKQSLKDINKNLVNDIKENINDIKKMINRD